jgi:hypothetical protein
MPSTPISREDPAEVLRGALALLQEFFAGPQRFAITNESLRDIIGTFGQRLDEAARRGQALALIRMWRGQLGRARAQVLEAGTKRGFASKTEGGPLALLTEREAAQLAGICPDKPEF